ncbi:MAG: GNAT family N-acetyltransferase [Burkholderiales bacterium]|nr:GNAT family N-acetyltransferase [Burkholderiales bacterium]
MIKPIWVELRPRVVVLEPFLTGNEEIPQLPGGMWLGRVIWDYDPAREKGASAKAWICQAGDYDFKDLHYKARNQTRKAEKEGGLVVRRNWDEVWERISELVDKTFLRQGRDSAKAFLQYLERLKALDESAWKGSVELWTAEKSGRIGALIIGLKYGGTYHILHQLSDTDELSWCPNNLATYHVTRHAMQDLLCDRVNYGVDGLDEGKLDGLATFKTRMGYELLPCREEFIGKPGVITALKLGAVVSEGLLRIFPTLSKMDSLRMLRGLGKRI